VADTGLSCCAISQVDGQIVLLGGADNGALSSVSDCLDLLLLPPCCAVCSFLQAVRRCEISGQRMPLPPTCQS